MVIERISFYRAIRQYDNQITSAWGFFTILKRGLLKIPVAVNSSPPDILMTINSFSAVFDANDRHAGLLYPHLEFSDIVDSRCCRIILYWFMLGFFSDVMSKQWNPQKMRLIQQKLTSSRLSTRLPPPTLVRRISCKNRTRSLPNSHSDFRACLISRRESIFATTGQWTQRAKMPPYFNQHFKNPSFMIKNVQLREHPLQ